MGGFFDRFKGRELVWWANVTPDQAADALYELDNHDDEWSRAIANGDREANLILDGLIGRKNDGLPTQYLEGEREIISAMITPDAGEAGVPFTMTFNLGPTPDPALEVAAYRFADRLATREAPARSEENTPQLDDSSSRAPASGAATMFAERE